MHFLRNKKLITSFISILLVSVVFFAPDVVHAAQTDFGLQNVQDQGLGLSSQSLTLTVVKIIRIVLGFLGLIAVVIVLYGGFVYMTAGGNEDKVSQAKMILRNGVIGLAIIFFSFAIVQFVITRLNQAAGIDMTDGADDTIGCTDVVSCNFNACVDNVFAAQSITPNQDSTEINNIVIRAVFTKSVGSSATDVFHITRGDVDVTPNFTYQFVPETDKKVVEAVMKLDGDVSVDCASDAYVDGTECLSLGSYDISINDTVVATDGTAITFGQTVCGDFSGMRDASFTAEIEANDVRNPTWQGVGILDPETNSPFTDAAPRLPAGETYTFVGTTNDDSGVAYVQFHLEATDGSEAAIEIYRGPSSGMSSSDPYVFSKDLFFSSGIVRNTNAPKQYEYTLTTWDIDHHVSSVYTGKFVLVGNHCFNEVMDVDLGETGIDVGGSCGSNTICIEDYQCASGLCVEGQCIAKPQITAVDPMDGAPGNWVTVRGYYFGTDVGTVEFGTEEDGWIEANIVACGDILTGSSWNNTYVIVEVPNNDAFAGTVTSSAIRITNSESGYTDATNDDFGPKPAYTDEEGTVYPDGLFRFTNTTRPGLCAVVVDGDQGDIPDGVAVAPAGIRIRAEGRKFGTRGDNDNITFDIGTDTPLAASIFGWGDTTINTAVPLAVAPGISLVHVMKDGVESNGIPFRVTNPDLSDAKPLISEISPLDPTPGSYITITGAHFGLAGIVYISPNAGAECSHGSTDDSCTELAPPPSPCQNTWTDTQIIADLPEDFSNYGTYYVTVERADNGLSTDGTEDIISIQNGAPKPSICQLTPNQGPSILPEEHPGLVFEGKNFTRGSTRLYFWNGAGDISNPDDVSDLDGGNWISWGDQSGDSRWGVSTDKKTIVSSVGYEDASEYPTMPLGQWPIAVISNGVRGNNVNYFVTDCRLEGSNAGDTNLQCCTEGPDAGSWKTVCEGDLRSSGYVWRFTTGIPPEIPYVLVQCSDDGIYTGQDVEASPVPSSEWDESEGMCINATAQVAISTSIDPGTVNVDSVLMYVCGSADSDITCRYDDADKVTDLDLELQSHTSGSVIAIKKASDLDTPNFEADTWYRVLLTTDIRSIEQAVGGGNSTSTPLRVDRIPEDFPYRDADIAFYYDFQTGTGLCSLDSAYITPREKTVTQIGPLYDLYNVDLPFYYYLKGKADRKCTILNVDGLGWEWVSNNTDKAEITVDSSYAIEDTRATAEAKQDAPEGVTFSASVSPDKLGENLAASFPDGLHANTSTLFIKIGPPHVTSYQPNCVDSCPNAVISATFSRHMDPGTYGNGGATVYQCADPNCVNVTDVTTRFTIDDTSKLGIRLSPAEGYLMQPNTYYKVVLSDDIKSVGGVDLVDRDGESLTPFSWVFRTKQDSTVCGVDRINVLPHPFTATYVGQKTKFTATPIGAPNQCNPRGQEIVRTSYTYKWQSTVPAVASTTQFAAALTGKANFCTQTCLPTGSDVNFDNKNTPICGNRIVDAGEDCDIAAPNESAGTTCTFSCLRPGALENDGNVCGANGKIDNPVSLGTAFTGGEACDPSATLQSSNGETISLAPYCTDQCLKTGSSQNFNPNTSGYCGDGFVGLEEACDIAIKVGEAETPNQSALGCTTSCLHQGTPISSAWCEDNANIALYGELPAFKEACGAAKSVCGNGIVEENEQCDTVNGVLPAYCSDTCTLQSACNTAEKQCDPAVDEGCTSACVYAGSSLFYSTPSVCGDGVVGIGEYPSCENADTVISTEQGALQLVTAVGQGETVEGKQTTQIQSEIPSEQVSGEATYTLQCGFTEFEESQNGFYNDCVLPAGDSGSAIDNELGVGYNSCCFYRPVRENQYPAEDEGFGNEEPICRNTYIEVEFTAEVDPKTIVDNAIIARGYESEVNCAELGGTDVTAEVNAALGLASGSADASGGFWSNVWQGIKRFFNGLITRVFAGNLAKENMQTWCSEGTLTTDIDTPATKIPLYLSKVLGSQTSDTAYAVLLRGGKVGIQDVYGVGIKNKTTAFTSDAWAFEVGTEICRIDDVVVQPSSYLFTTPNTSADFAAAALTKRGQPIVSTPAYAWRWEWQPQESTIFNIPADNASSTTAFTKMGSTNVEGNTTALASVIVTADLSTTGNQLGNRFDGTTELTSMFCENPWPARAADGSWSPYRDNTYNYLFSYCADAGQSGNTNDDLPFLLSNDIDINDANDDVLKRLLFVSQINTDALGIQIFANPERLSAASWFAKKFPNAPIPQKVTIGEYDAVADQDNYYINAMNIVKDANGTVVNAYSNIYLFTVSQAAQASTRNVFQQILDTLTFNTNLTDYGYCLGYDGVTPDFENACTTDFDCLLGPQRVTLQVGQVGECADGTSAACMTNADCKDSAECKNAIPEETAVFTSAGCSADKTKLLRDIERLQDVEVLQSTLSSGPYPTLAKGTFRPNYVASVWSSWGVFGNALGANMPQDPINIWSGCNPADPQTCWASDSSTFVCPQNESVYEYNYDDETGTYKIHMPFEFFKNELQLEAFFAESFILDTEAFTTARECQPGQTYTFAASACGDGVVGPGEQCDPPGSTSIGSTAGVTVQSYGSCEYTGTQCLYDSECGSVYTFDGKSSDGTDTLVTKTVHTGHAGTFCGYATGELIVNNIVSDPDAYTYSLFSCNTNADCLNVDNYLEQANPTTGGYSVYAGIDLGAFGNNPALYNFTDLETGLAGVTCLNFEDRLQDSAIDYLSNDQQCSGAVLAGEIIQCSTNQFATKTCNTSCQWEYGACEATTDCGNGRVEGDEKCDDGGLNNQYGQCNDQCTGLAASCGDGHLDTGYEQCDWGIAGTTLYATDKANSCSWDCQEYGSYCGDGVVDTADGETCDDGNNEGGDGCSQICTAEGFCEYPDRQEFCYIDSMCPVIRANGIQISGKEDQQICMYNGTDIVYRQNENNIFTVYPCTNDDVCQNVDTYQRTNFNYEYDYPEIYTLDQAVSFEFPASLQNVTCGSITDAVLLANSSYITDTNASCVPTEVEITGTQITEEVQNTQDSTSSCGNGTVDTGEQCDPADPNTKTAAQCTSLGYGQSCTYCSNTCQIETVDSQLYCGNGVIDQKAVNVYEACDVLADGSVVTSTNGIVANCDGYEYGTVSCTNSCSVFTNSCFNCGLDDNGALARISILNPMVPKESSFRLPGTGLQVYLYKLMNGEIETLAGNYRTGTLPGDSGFARGAEENILGDSSVMIETAPICSPNCNNGDCGESSGYYASFSTTFGGVSIANTKFPYIVADQSTSVTNEYVLSPNVPDGSIRVVIRWTKAEEDENANMRGFIYSDATNGTYLRGFSDAVANPDYLCTNVAIRGVALIPWECNSYEGGIYIHKETGLTNIFVQAMTLNLTDMRPTNDEPLAFVVTNQEGGIFSWRNKNIFVDVYTYHADQSNGYMYGPTFTYNIRTSANTSSNEAAQWWHVFNLIPQEELLESEIDKATLVQGTDYFIVPVESIVTDDCELHNNIYTNQVDCSEQP